MFFEVTQIRPNSLIKYDPEGPVTLSTSRVLSVRPVDNAAANEKGIHAVIEYLGDYNLRRIIYTAETKQVIDDLLGTRTSNQRLPYADN